MAAVAAACELEPVQAITRHISWAPLLERVFDIDIRYGPKCDGGELKIVAAILERPVIEKILAHLSLDPHPAQGSSARGRAGTADADVERQPMSGLRVRCLSAVEDDR